MAKVADIFHKPKGEGAKVKYRGSLWEGKYADEQKAKGNEPWLDLNLSTVVNGKRVYATKIVYGNDEAVLNLGPQSGVFLKVGLVRGAKLTLPEPEVAEQETLDEAEASAPAETAEATNSAGAIDLSELE